MSNLLARYICTASIALHLCFAFSASPQVQAASKHHQTNAAPPPIANLPSGAVLQGVTDEANYLAYWEGVRYAKPPVGNFRFAPPQPIDAATQNTPAAATSGSSGGHAGYDNASHPRFRPLYHHLRRVKHVGKRGLRAAHRQAKRSLRALRKHWGRFITPMSRRASVPVITDRVGPTCSQTGDVSQQSEDCLYINIYKPYNASSSASLPVLLYIHGGGFQAGAGSQFDPTPIIRAGLRYGQPVMIATINYRLNIFGFLSSSDLAELAGLNPSGCSANANGCTTDDLASEPVGINLGYQDMKMAIQWAYTNIAAFGGDPGRIIIWGQSAGSFGVSAQLLGHPGTPLDGASLSGSNPPRPPFRAAIMMSGAPSGPAIPEPMQQDQAWNTTLSDAGCDGPSYATAQARLRCLRQVDWTILRRSASNQNSVTGNPGQYVLGNYRFVPTFDGGPRRGGFLSRRPSDTLAAGSYAAVPVMIGDTEDEGTVFAPRSFNETQQLSEWLTSIYFANGSPSAQETTLASMLDAYPDIPSEGSPYSPRSGGSNSRYFGPTNQYKRVAALYGDIRFQSNRRNFLTQGLRTGTTPAAWSWLYQHPAYRESVFLGVSHSNDVNAMFNKVADRNHPSPFQTVMSRQWISFATHLDPTAEPGLPAWPRYDLDSRSMMSYTASGKPAIIQDTYREGAMDVLNSEVVLNVTNR